jgi:hypothetical protein
MSHLMPIAAFSTAPLSSITLPGTHNSLSYDLSLTVSKDGIDNQKKISEWLRKLSIIDPSSEIEEFMRLQAATQKLDIVEQLDNGIRFIDLRIELESNKDIWIGGKKQKQKQKPAWYSIHCLQSNYQVDHYLRLIHTWMEGHPNEFIVIYLSRRGETDAVGNEAYPNTSVEEKRYFWENYLDIFEEMLFDTSVSNYRITPMATLLERNHRVVTFVGDYDIFTNTSRFAYDAKHIENEYNADCFHEEESIVKQTEYFFRKKDPSSTRWFALKGMNTAVVDWQVESALRQRFLPIDLFDSCLEKVNIPGNKMCPRSVLDIAQLTNYYNQIPLEKAYAAHMKKDDNHKGTMQPPTFPHAFYLDAIDYEGTLRTGTKTLSGLGREGSDPSHWFTRYAFVATVIGINLHTICRNGSTIDQEICQHQYSKRRCSICLSSSQALHHCY